MAGNKFWGGDSASSSSEDSDSSEDAPVPAAAQAAPRRQMTRWAEESSSDDEDQKKRVVRSHADKRFDQMRDRIKQMKNHKKIDDFANLITDYEAILKMLEKTKNANDPEGGPPAIFVKAIGGLEVYVDQRHAVHQEMKAEKGTKLPENKQRAFNTLRAKVRKGNRPWQDQVDKYKENPDEFGSDDNADAEDDADSESESSASAKGGSGGSSSSSSSSSSSGSSSDSDSDSNSDSDSDSSSSDSDSDSSFSGESESYKSGTDENSDEDVDEDTLRERKMIRWVITDEKKAKEAMKLAKVQDQKKEKDVKGGKVKTSKSSKSAKSKKDDERASKRDEQQDYSPEELMKKVNEIAQQRGRRGFDRSKYMESLKLLMPHAAKQGARAQLYIFSAMIAADFDNTGGAFAPMRTDMWTLAFEKITKCLPLLQEYYGDQGPSEEKDDTEDQASYSRQQELFVAYVEKLDDELHKALQITTDVYGADYMEILGNNSKYIVLLRRVIKFLQEIEQAAPLGALSLRLVEQLYYKPDVLNSCVFSAIQHSVDDKDKADWDWPEDSKAYMSQLCQNVRACDNIASTRRAVFCQVYHLALHDRFQEARDLIHLGNLAEQAENSDVRTQILNNRVVAQMGLCAFRLGKIHEAHQCLMAICMHNKARELLAQGLSYSKNMERTQDQERAERLRQLPYHMHINLEVLDSAHHICAMLLEIPNLAMQGIDPASKTRVISRVLRRHLEAHDKNLFIGPPENAKECVLSASKSLQRGDWQSACAVLENLRLWEHIDPSGPEGGQKVKEIIKEKIKIEALRTYLFAYASIYDAFQLSQLVSMFELDSKMVHSIVSKMMIKEELAAFWDESSKFVLVQHSEPTQLQRLALTLADRGAQAVDNNERLVDQKGGGSGFKDQRQQQVGRFDQPGQGVNARRFGKGVGLVGRDEKGRKGKGRGKLDSGPPRNRGWENARAGALRGTGQRGWAAGTVRTA